MTDEQLTEWCVGKVRDWLATGHPSAWRAWGGVYGDDASRVLAFALIPVDGKWTSSRSEDSSSIIFDMTMPTCFRSYDALHITNDAITAILNPNQRIGKAITSEEMELLTQEAAAIATNPTDWRTLDAVPEDYYAL